MSVLRGDCVEVMAGMEPDSVDAIVCDPPYFIGFMGKEWDGQPRTFLERKSVSASGGFDAGAGNHHPTSQADVWRTAVAQGRRMYDWHAQWAAAALRVAKPGAYLLAFGGTRTVHRMTCALEDAGWVIRDELMWVYASGFPKSLDVSKAIDKAAGAEREVVGSRVLTGRAAQSIAEKGGTYTAAAPSSAGLVKEVPVTAPATDSGREWSGWGTALKPAHEPIVMARKPLIGTVAQNVQEHGTGALNIDGCRIGTEVVVSRRGLGRYANMNDDGWKGIGQPQEPTVSQGRWPANVILTDPVFDGGWDGVVGGGDAGAMRRGILRRGATTGKGIGYKNGSTGEAVIAGYGDSGTYSRFFLVPKAPSRERTLTDGRRSPHPTQKPEALIRHLVTMVTPPGGIVLDPFLGSGTLGVVCEALGLRWLGIEREDEYADWAEDRIADRKAKWEVTA